MVYCPPDMKAQGFCRDPNPCPTCALDLMNLNLIMPAQQNLVTYPFGLMNLEAVVTDTNGDATVIKKGEAVDSDGNLLKTGDLEVKNSDGTITKLKGSLFLVL